MAAALASSACGADPTSVPGALSGAASAVGRRDYQDLFQLLDQRARYALGSVYDARKRAAAVIRQSYPEPAQAAALAELGDAIEVESAVELFQRRCDQRCLDAFATALGAPSEVRVQGELSIVKTVHGTELELYRGDDERYGLVWETPALVRERARAAAELDLIQKNAELYRAQRALRQSP